MLIFSYNVCMGKQREVVLEVERLSRTIEKRGLTFGQLEIQTGVSKSQISLMVNEKRPNASAIIVGKLAQVLGCSVDYLLGLTDDPRPVSAIASPHHITEEQAAILEALSELPPNEQEFVKGIIQFFNERNTPRIIGEETANDEEFSKNE